MARRQPRLSAHPRTCPSPGLSPLEIRVRFDQARGLALTYPTPCVETMPSRPIEQACRNILAPSPVSASLSWMPSRIALLLRDSTFDNRFLRSDHTSASIDRRLAAEVVRYRGSA